MVVSGCGGTPVERSGGKSGTNTVRPLVFGTPPNIWLFAQISLSLTQDREPKGLPAMTLINDHYMMCPDVADLLEDLLGMCRSVKLTETDRVQYVNLADYYVEVVGKSLTWFEDIFYDEEASFVHLMVLQLEKAVSRGIEFTTLDKIIQLLQ